MNFEINKSENRIEVNVSIPKRKRADQPSIVVNTKKVIAYLEESGYNDIQSLKLVEEGLCSTLQENHILKSKWVFEVVKKPKVKSSNEKTTTRRKRTASRTRKPATSPVRKQTSKKDQLQ